MNLHTMTDLGRMRTMTSAELRQTFLVEALFQPGAITLVRTDLDRAIVGSAVPGARALTLEPPPELRASSFTERRELGVLNLGGAGSILVDGERHAMAARDALYVGRGDHKIVFESDRPDAAARFYFVSYPAHAVYPTTHASFADAAPLRLGTSADANERTIYKYIHEDGIQSCQLMMGFTWLEEGSVWNTMPPHWHLSRSEIYLYFDLPAEACVIHLMGAPDETRHLIVRNEQAVLSPPWSIHSGAGTQRYGFAWAMGGENREFADMEAVSPKILR
ncbi:5-dehydro-4-deoxy-D-glucuronate isomerase [Synoicihabitans lomoniglobus]|uniref:4-deoxy-L-threo-5-hexosulose-uronate ketol-isomerase n=1 Tax=Synoicihabitans lomoniglobus TaxID=2909285 RepID=A0AAE9ZV83_9BACT|nr:5-dehydro-4-deoxy-D-glucuronate isomerase [Opitutaceae bacterium LMO-M01]WED64722.1 5-dehydro-4-deoxy-D-glucuronate isomerase [Opitutaceae bacterium LMO-M01]